MPYLQARSGPDDTTSLQNAFGMCNGYLQQTLALVHAQPPTGTAYTTACATTACFAAAGDTL